MSWSVTMLVLDRLEGLTVGTAKRFYYDDRDTPDIPLLSTQSVVLEDLGAQVVTADLPELMISRSWTPNAVCRGLCHSRGKTQDPMSEFGPLSRNRMMLGAFVRSSDYLQAQRRRNFELAVIVDNVFQRCDVLVAPAMLVPAAPMDSDETFPFLAAPMINVPFNLTDHPAVSVRCGFQESGMPIGAHPSPAAGMRPERCGWRMHMNGPLVGTNCNQRLARFPQLNFWENGKP